jgi:hypothetical protein
MESPSGYGVLSKTSLPFNNKDHSVRHSRESGNPGISEGYKQTGYPLSRV